MLSRQALAESLHRMNKRLPWLRWTYAPVQAFFLWLIWRLLLTMTPDRASKFGAAVGRCLGPWLVRSRHVRRNYGLIFPELSAAEIEALVRAHWANFGAVLAEFPHLGEICDPRSSVARIEVAGREHLPQFWNKQTPAIFVAAHMGNWEVPAAWLGRQGFPLTVIYSAQSDPVIDRMVQARRRHFGCQFVTKQGAVRELARALDAGHSLGLLVDQRVDGEAEVPLFGYPTPTTTVPAKLSLMAGVPLVPVRIERLGPARFRVTVMPPIEAGASVARRNERALEMTLRLNRLFEQWIRERPGEWLCSKRRWPKRFDPLARVDRA